MKRFGGLEQLRSSLGWPYLSAVVALSLVFPFLTVGSLLIGHKSLTYDEPQHFRYGEQILDLNSDRFDDSKMPISVLNVLPSRLAERLVGDRFDPWQVMSIGRLSTVVFSWGLGLLCLTWACSLYGKWAGLAAFGLYVFEPNIVAHSRLITTDIYAAGTITLALWLFWRLLEEPGFRRGLPAAAALGLAQVAKYSALLLVLVLPLVALAWHREGLPGSLTRRSRRQLWDALRKALAYAMLFLLVSLVIINAAFLFNQTGAPLDSYDLRSDVLQSLRDAAPHVPIPLPVPYLDGLDQVLYNERTGSNYGNLYLLGELRQAEGFPHYFAVAALFKVPIAILILLAAALVGWLRRRGDWRLRRRELFLLIPALTYGLYFSLFFRAQIGIRFLLVVFPVLLVFASRTVRSWERLSRRARWGMAGLAAYLVVSVASYFPHYLSYFNELVPDRKLAYRILADSNLDWGQNRSQLAAFLDENPEVIFEPEGPMAGSVMVGVNELTGVLGGPQRYQWLREGYLPVGQLDYTYLIYDIDPDE